MQRWAVWILSAVLTFAIGTGAAIIGSRQLTRATQLLTACDVANMSLPQVPSWQPSEIRCPVLVSISPYEIKRLIDENGRAASEHQSRYLDLEPVWKQLQLAPQHGIDFIAGCHGDCTAVISRLELDGRPGWEVLLRIEYPSWKYHYLIFTQPGRQHPTASSWELLGYLDYESWWDEPSLRVVSAGANRWMLIKHITGHGSGYGRFDEDWYEVGAGGVTQVLTYQADLFDVAWDLGLRVESATKVLSTGFNDGEASVTLQFSNSYESLDLSKENLPLWRTKRKVTFVKHADSSGFTFDPLRSEMSEEEMSFLQHFDEEYSEKYYREVILKYNYQALSKIAAGRDTKRKEWLRSFLDRCDQTSEKEALNNMLSRQ